MYNFMNPQQPQYGGMIPQQVVGPSGLFPMQTTGFDMSSMMNMMMMIMMMAMMMSMVGGMSSSPAKVKR